MSIKKALYRAGVRLALAALCSRGTYQPVELRGRTIARGRRGTIERYASLEPLLRDSGSVTDLGCAEGFMVRRCAERGIFVLGVDENLRALSTAHLSLAGDNLSGWALARMKLDADSVTQLPPADTTLFLSVMHHIVVEHGMSHAERMLRSIRQRTRHLLIFEMGQSNESAFPWASRLPDMGVDPHQWIADWLTACGFKEVRPICALKSYNSHIERMTFAAS